MQITNYLWRSRHYHLAEALKENAPNLSVYKPALQIIQYIAGLVSDVLNFSFSHYYHTVTIGDFNVKPIQAIDILIKEAYLSFFFGDTLR